MTNVSGPGKVAIRNFLRKQAGKELEKLGYKVERIPRAGKGSLRRITKDGVSQKVSIRTSQDTWIAFPRNADNSGWSTLEDADVVVAASLTEKGGTRANFHLMDGNDIRARFDRALQARLKANHVVPAERGIWISLYSEEASAPVSMVGAGAGLAYKPFAENVPVIIEDASNTNEQHKEEAAEQTACSTVTPLEPIIDERLLTIAEAKRRLALTFSVDPSAIKIVVEV